MGKLFNDSCKVIQFNGGVRRGGVSLRPDEEVRTTEAQDVMLRKDPTFKHYLQQGGEREGERARPALLDRGNTFSDLVTAPVAVKIERHSEVVNPRKKKERADVVVPPVQAGAHTDVPVFGPPPEETPEVPLTSLSALTVEDAVTRVNACDSLDVLRGWFEAGAARPVIDAINARGSHLVALQQQK